MGTAQDHRRWAEECLAMARSSQLDGDKALWLTLAQSWVRLAEHVTRAGLDFSEEASGADDELAPDSDNVRAFPLVGSD